MATVLVAIGGSSLAESDSAGAVKNSRHLPTENVNGGAAAGKGESRPVSDLQEDTALTKADIQSPP